MLLTATGTSRNRVKWESLKHIRLPKPSASIVSKAVTFVNEADDAQGVAKELRRRAEDALESPLNLKSDEAWQILRAFRPPK